ncbi:MAG: glycine cleavage system protein GcvH [Paludibacteraceae bacterium]|nr:glycine cleavage system protein GcvH [Paludibacteraceae bacterium]MBQ4033235.1 glycine cleavage system protein GcvH [Paludibacteraceae bacterium]MBQ5524216.1 glycine cleavage system protein GcvH [Paludibacteraceae bacterium]
MNIPENLKYLPTHEWVLVEGSKAKVGISDYAQHALGDVVYISLPEVGDEVTADESFADVESVKAASEVFSPVTGTVTAINDALDSDAGLLNQDPYANWIIEVEFTELSDKLVDAAEYEKLLENA